MARSQSRRMVNSATPAADSLGPLVSPRFDSHRRALVVVNAGQSLAPSIEGRLRDHFDVHVVGTGQQALALLGDQPVEVVVTPQRMPDMTCAEFLAGARQLNAEVPALLLTSCAGGPEVGAAVNLGQVHFYLDQPWDPAGLLAAVEAAAEKARQNRHGRRQAAAGPAAPAELAQPAGRPWPLDAALRASQQQLDRLTRESDQRQAELEAILAILAAMRRAANRSELVAILLQRSMQALGAAGIALVVPDPFQGPPYIEQGSGLLAPFTGRRLPADINLAALAGLARPGQQGDLGSPGAALAGLELPRELLYLTGMPLVNQRELLGVLLVGHEYEVSAARTRLLATVSEIAASALQRVTLSDLASHYTRQLATAGELGLMLAQTLDLSAIYAYAGQFMQAMLPDVAGLFVALFDPVSAYFTCVYAYGDGQMIDAASLPRAPLEPPGRGMQSQAVHTRLPVIIGDMTEIRKQSQLSITIGDDDTVTRSGLFVPMLAHERVIGVVSVQSYTVNRFSKEDAEVMTLVSNTTAVAIENARLVRGLQESNRELVEAYDATIAGWSHALDLRDRETEGHSLRVVEMAARLASALGLDENDLVQIRRGALLHDIGKMGTPDSILLKPGPLTPEEQAVMQRHPVYAYDMLAGIDFLRPALDIPYCHHEKWDGTGYPRGLRGEAIPLSARIFALADVWDALNSDRPYRRAWPADRARQYIRDQAGRHFDPAVVEVFLRVLEETSSPSLNQAVS